MHILYNIPYINKEWGGIYQYAESLLRILGEAKLNHQFYINNRNEDEVILAIIEKYDNFHLFESNNKVQNSINKLIKLQSTVLFPPEQQILELENILDIFLSEYKIDLIHTPYQVLVQTKKIPGISTLHDVQEIHFPEYFSTVERAKRALRHKYCVEEGQATIVSYPHVQKDLLKYFQGQKETIFPVLLDMEKLWIDNYDGKEITDVRKKYDLPSNFLLYPAATWKHKNHIQLIETIAYLKETKGLIISIVCTGKRTEYYEEIQDKINLLDVNEQVYFLGVVSEIELYSLYKTCRAVVVPTLYEAGSFPLMESILLKIPVICSNVTSLPSTIKDTQFIFDPMNVEDMAAKMEKIFIDDQFAKDSIANSKRVGPSIRNNNAAQKVDNIYTTLYKQKEQALSLNSSLDDKENIPVVHNAEPLFEFSGSVVLVEKEKHAIYDLLETLEEYTIQISLKPSYNSTSIEGYSSTAPPMPFIIGPFALLDKGAILKVLWGNFEKEQALATTLGKIENNLEWCILEFYHNRKEKQLRISKDGQTIDAVKVNNFQCKRNVATLGNVYDQRYWKGAIGQIHIKGKEQIDIPSNEKEILIRTREELLERFKVVDVKRN